MTPKEFFDQFLPHLEGIGASNQWCARHWAPSPLMGANGIGASMELLGVWVEGEADTGADMSPDAMNARMEAAGPLCCQVGDAQMYVIWGHWPPSGPSA